MPHPIEKGLKLAWKYRRHLCERYHDDLVQVIQVAALLTQDKSVLEFLRVCATEMVKLERELGFHSKRVGDHKEYFRELCFSEFAPESQFKFEAIQQSPFLGARQSKQEYDKKYRKRKQHDQAGASLTVNADSE